MCIVGGCRWIEREDFLEQLREGREIFCGAPVERQGEAWCSVHRARVCRSRGAGRPRRRSSAAAAEPVSRATPQRGVA
jgi:hypothetical protein